jgi:hypothetical protein
MHFYRQAHTVRGFASESLNQDIDFGFAAAGSTVRRTFSVRNESGKAWIVTGVKSSCSCTAGNVPPVFPPNDEIGVPVTLRLPENDQEVSSRVTVAIKDSAPLTFTLHGRAVRFAPTLVNLGRCRRDECKPQEFRIRSTNERVVRPTGVNWEEGVFDLAYGADSVIPRDTLFTLRLKPNGASGRVDSTIAIQTDDPDHPMILIPVHAYILQPFEPDPQILTFGEIAAGQSATATLRIESTYGDPIMVRAVRTGNPRVISCDLSSATPDAKGLVLTFTANANFDKPLLKVPVEIDVGEGANAQTLVVDAYVKRKTD